MNLGKFRTVITVAIVRSCAAQRASLDRFECSETAWCPASAESVALSLPLSGLEPDVELRSDNVAQRLPRPGSYTWLRIAGGLGALWARLMILCLVGFGLAFMVSGALSSGSWLSVLCGTLTAALTATLNLIFSGIIGLCALFIDDTSALYWVWQKLTFALGGPVFPLDMYAGTVLHVADVTPFPSVLCAPPGGLPMEAESRFPWQTGLVFTGLLLVVVLSAHFAFRRALKSLEQNAG